MRWDGINYADVESCHLYPGSIVSVEVKSKDSHTNLWAHNKEHENTHPDISCLTEYTYKHSAPSLLYRRVKSKLFSHLVSVRYFTSSNNIFCYCLVGQRQLSQGSHIVQTDLKQQTCDHLSLWTLTCRSCQPDCVCGGVREAPDQWTPLYALIELCFVWLLESITRKCNIRH